MKLLVLGNSDTSAAFSGGQSWADRVRHGLQQSLGHDVEYEHTIFSAFGPKSAGFAETRVRDAEADIVILPIGDFAFTTGFVWMRVQSLLGKRVGRWYRHAEERFDAATRGQPGGRASLNAIVRRWARRLIGTQPLMSLDETTAAYEGIIRAIARIENTHVVLVEYPTQGAPLEKKGMMAERQRFAADLRAIAHEHRYQWVSANDAIAHLPPGTSVVTPDGFHMNELGHELLAAHLTRELLPLLAAARA